MKKFLFIIPMMFAAVSMVGCNGENTETNNMTKQIDNSINNVINSTRRIKTLDNDKLTIEELTQLTNTNNDYKNVNNSTKYAQNGTNKVVNNSTQNINNTQYNGIARNSTLISNTTRDVNNNTINSYVTDGNTATNRYTTAKYEPRFVATTTDTSQKLTNYVERIQDLYNICNDACGANALLGSMKQDLIQSCNNCKNLLSQVKTGKITLTEKELETLDDYCDTIDNCVINLNNCQDCTGDVQLINALKGNFSNNCDSLVAKYLKVINNLDANINICNSAKCSIDELNNYISKLTNKNSTTDSVSNATNNGILKNNTTTYRPKYYYNNTANNSKLTPNNQNNYTTNNNFTNTQQKTSTTTSSPVYSQTNKTVVDNSQNNANNNTTITKPRIISSTIPNKPNTTSTQNIYRNNVNTSNQRRINNYSTTTTNDNTVKNTVAQTTNHTTTVNSNPVKTQTQEIKKSQNKLVTPNNQKNAIYKQNETTKNKSSVTENTPVKNISSNNQNKYINRNYYNYKKNNNNNNDGGNKILPQNPMKVNYDYSALNNSQTVYNRYQPKNTPSNLAEPNQAYNNSTIDKKDNNNDNDNQLNKETKKEDTITKAAVPGPTKTLKTMPTTKIMLGPQNVRATTPAPTQTINVENSEIKNR